METDDLSVFLSALPADGRPIGNTSLQRQLGWESDRYESAKLRLAHSGEIKRGQGRGGTVARVDLDAVELEADKRTFVYSLPEPDRAVGNTALRRQLGWDESRYERVKAALIVDGHILKQRGPGGAVRRSPQLDVEVDEGATDGEERAETQRELALYEPFERSLRKWAEGQGWLQKDLALIGSQGRRRTGGTWSRPDFVVVGVKSYDYTPYKTRDVETWEVKTAACSITAVFETAAHSRAATKSYLAIHTTGGAPAADELARIESECARFGLGLVTFSDAAEPGSWQFRVQPTRREPDPDLLEIFVKTQVPRQLQERFRQMLK